MPRGDRTGPAGQGPMTGRAMGFCAGYNMPGYMNPGFGFGRGFRGRGGFGRGFGGRWRFAPVTPIWEPVGVQQPQPYQPTKQEEIQMLEDESKAVKQEQEMLKQELEEIKKRIEELKKQK